MSGEELMRAIVSEDVDTARALIDHTDFDPDSCDENGGTLLNNACAFSMPVDVIQKLLKKGADPNIPNNSGSTPLIHAVYARCPIEVVRVLIDAKADVKYKNKAGGTPLIIACICGCEPEVIQLLVNSGADPSARNSTGNSALMYAIRNNNSIETIKILIKSGAPVNDKTFKSARYSEFSSLHFAAGEGRKDVCVLLIESGADVNACNSENLTPLQIAKQDTKAAMTAAIQRLGINYSTDTRKKAGSVIKSGIAPANPLVTRESKAGKIGVRKTPGVESEINGDSISLSVNDNNNNNVTNNSSDFQYENHGFDQQHDSSTTFAYDPFSGSSNGYDSYGGGSYMSGGYYTQSHDQQQQQQDHYQQQDQYFYQNQDQSDAFQFSNPSQPNSHHQGSSGFI